MTIDMNLDGVDAWAGGALLSPGTHICRITEAAEGKSTGGHPQIELSLEAIDGPEQGGTIKDWIVIVQATLGKVKQLFDAAGYEPPPGDFAFDASALVGRTVKIIVREEPKGDGSSDTRNRVKAYDAPGEPVAAGQNGHSSEPDIPF